jgi:predicted ester cyclase
VRPTHPSIEEKTLTSTPEAVLRRFYEEFWNNGNAEAADELVDPHVVDHQLYDGQQGGIAGFKQLVDEWRVGFPDMSEEIEEIIVQGDLAVGRFRLRGTHTGPFLGIAPTGRSVEIRGIDMVRVVDGRITDFWYNEQTFELLIQLGVLPPAATLVSMDGSDTES